MPPKKISSVVEDELEEIGKSLNFMSDELSKVVVVVVVAPLLSLVTSTSKISHQPVHTYTTYIYDKGVDRTGRQVIEEKYSIT